MSSSLCSWIHTDRPHKRLKIENSITIVESEQLQLPWGSCSAEYLMVHSQQGEGIPDLCCCNTPTPPEYNLSSLEVSPHVEETVVLTSRKLFTECSNLVNTSYCYCPVSIPTHIPTYLLYICSETWIYCNVQVLHSQWCWSLLQCTFKSPFLKRHLCFL